MKFTVLTVCKNDEKHIGKACESVSNLDHDNYEHVLQDGGSADRTLEIIREYASGRPNVILYRLKDEAPLDGLLKILSTCEGEIIACCWSDDELMPNALKWAELHFSETPDCDIIYGDQLIHDHFADKLIPNVGREWDFKDFLYNQFYPPFSSAFFRKSALEKLIGNLTVFDHDEWEFWCLLDILGCKIKYIPGEAVSKFGIHEKTKWWGKNALTYVPEIAKGKYRALERLMRYEKVNQYPRAKIEESIDFWVYNHLLASAPKELQEMMDEKRNKKVSQ